jgi:hypothetical protein
VFCFFFFLLFSNQKQTPEIYVRRPEILSPRGPINSIPAVHNVQTKSKHTIIQVESMDIAQGKKIEERFPVNPKYLAPAIISLTINAGVHKLPQVIL